MNLTVNNNSPLIITWLYFGGQRSRSKSHLGSSTWWWRWLGRWSPCFSFIKLSFIVAWTHSETFWSHPMQAWTVFRPNVIQGDQTWL